MPEERPEHEPSGRATRSRDAQRPDRRCELASDGHRVITKHGRSSIAASRVGAYTTAVARNRGRIAHDGRTVARERSGEDRPDLRVAGDELGAQVREARRRGPPYPDAVARVDEDGLAPRDEALGPAGVRVGGLRDAGKGRTQAARPYATSPPNTTSSTHDGAACATASHGSAWRRSRTSTSAGADPPGATELSSSPAMRAASTVTIRTSWRAVAGRPSSINAWRATLSSASRLGLPLGSQSAPRPTGSRAPSPLPPGSSVRTGAGCSVATTRAWRRPAATSSRSAGSRAVPWMITVAGVSSFAARSAANSVARAFDRRPPRGGRRAL